MKIAQSTLRKVIQEEIAKVNEAEHRRPNALDRALAKRELDYGRWANPDAWDDEKSGKTDYRNKPFVMDPEDSQNYTNVLAKVEAGEMTAEEGADELIRIVLNRSAGAPPAVREVDAPMEEANENAISIHGAMEYINHVEDDPDKFTEEIKAALLRQLQGMKSDDLQNLLARINEKGVDYTKNPAYQTIAAAAAAQKDNNMKITESQLRKIIKEELSAFDQSYTDARQVRNELVNYFAALPGGQALVKSDAKLLDTLSAQVAAREMTLDKAKAKLSKSKGIEFEAPMEEAAHERAMENADLVNMLSDEGIIDLEPGGAWKMAAVNDKRRALMRLRGAYGDTAPKLRAAVKANRGEVQALLKLR